MVSGAGDSALNKLMLEELDAAYLRTDDTMKLLEFKSVPPAVYNLTRKEKDGVLYYDSADRIVFPYSFEPTVDGLSTVMMSSPDVDFKTVKVEDLKDTLTIKYQVKYQLSKTESVSFRIHGAAKKWREKHRLVLLWRCYTEGLGEFEGLHSNETTWLVTRPFVEDCDQSCRTVLESYTRLAPTGTGFTPACDGAVDRFVEILARSGEEEYKQMMRMMETVMTNDQ
ncbi:hypothetical protein PInf_018500 [Phytophthora infestans]|nr:hypothetical protein PInf_018500 [Phytophthora infestans]